VVFRTKCLFGGSTFGKRGGFPDGVSFLGEYVREKGWFSGRSASFGSNRSGKGVVFRTKCLFGGSTFGKMGDFPDEVSFWEEYVRENGWFSGRSASFGSNRSGKGVISRMEGLQQAGFLKDFADGRVGVLKVFWELFGRYPFAALDVFLKLGLEVL